MTLLKNGLESISRRNSTLDDKIVSNFIAVCVDEIRHFLHFTSSI